MKENKTILKVILIALLIVILLLPIFIFINNDNKNKKYDELVAEITSAAEKLVNRNSDLLVDGKVKIKLSDLKEVSLINISIINPITHKSISNESYVDVTINGGIKNYRVTLYDIPSKENTANLIINMLGDKNMQNGISVRYEEQGIEVLDGLEKIEYSVQYFLKDKEVSGIDSSRPRTYEVVYTALNNEGELAKVVRKVVIQ